MGAAKRLYEFQTTGGIFVQQGPCLLKCLHRAECFMSILSQGMLETPASPACQVELCLGDTSKIKIRHPAFQNHSRNLRPKMSKVLHDAQALPHLVSRALRMIQAVNVQNRPNFLEVRACLTHVQLTGVVCVQVFKNGPEAPWQHAGGPVRYFKTYMYTMSQLLP